MSSKYFLVFHFQFYVDLSLFVKCLLILQLNLVFSHKQKKKKNVCLFLFKSDCYVNDIALKWIWRSWSGSLQPEVAGGSIKENESRIRSKWNVGQYCPKISERLLIVIRGIIFFFPTLLSVSDVPYINLCYHKLI